MEADQVGSGLNSQQIVSCGFSGSAEWYAAFAGGWNGSNIFCNICQTAGHNSCWVGVDACIQRTDPPQQASDGCGWLQVPYGTVHYGYGFQCNSKHTCMQVCIDKFRGYQCLGFGRQPKIYVEILLTILCSAVLALDLLQHRCSRWQTPQIDEFDIQDGCVLVMPEHLWPPANDLEVGGAFPSWAGLIVLRNAPAHFMNYGY